MVYSFEHSIAYLSGMMFLRCNQTHPGRTLANYSPPMPMRFDVRSTSSACLLENNHGGRAGCDGMNSSYCGPSRKSHNAKAPAKLSVPRKMLVILFNESIHLFNRRKVARLVRPSRVVRSQVELSPASLTEIAISSNDGGIRGVWGAVRDQGDCHSEARNYRSNIDPDGSDRRGVAGARRLEHNGYDNPDFPDVPISSVPGLRRTMA